MTIDYHRLFKKVWKRLPLKIKQGFRDKVKIFQNDRFNSTLNNHPLQGEYAGCRSINITGDYRAIFVEDTDSIKFLRIGTHTELYGK